MINQEQQTAPPMGELSHDALIDISALVRAALVTDCPLVGTYDEISRDGVDRP